MWDGEEGEAWQRETVNTGVFARRRFDHGVRVEEEDNLGAVPEAVCEGGRAGGERSAGCGAPRQVQGAVFPRACTATPDPPESARCPSQLCGSGVMPER